MSAGARRPKRPLIGMIPIVRVAVFRYAITNCLLVLLLVGCTTVTPPTASHPSKSLQAQDSDKYECWAEARSGTGHDPEGSSPVGRFLGNVMMAAMYGAGAMAVGGGAAAPLASFRRPGLAVPVAIAVPVAVALPVALPTPGGGSVRRAPSDPAGPGLFREAYGTCLTGRGYSVQSSR